MEGKFIMKTCPYCGSNIEVFDSQFYYCDFCCMKLEKSIIKENHERLNIRFRDFVLDSQIAKTTPELMTLSSFELLYLLKAIRSERSNSYNFLHMENKIKDMAPGQLDDLENFSGDNYTYYTKKMFVVENILRQRLGFVPDRITDNYLAKYLDNIKKGKNSPMVIRTTRKKVTK
jgi:hypothetical protein